MVKKSPQALAAERRAEEREEAAVRRARHDLGAMKIALEATAGHAPCKAILAEISRLVSEDAHYEAAAAILFVEYAGRLAHPREYAGECSRPQDESCF